MIKKRAAKILVVIPTDTFTQRQTLEGLLEYAHRNTDPPWQLHLDLSDMNPQAVRRPQTWGCDGIIAYVRKAEDRRKFMQTGLPTLLIDPYGAKAAKRHPAKKVVSIINDHEEEGRTAADYFLARGYAHYAYVGTAVPLPWSADRFRGFSDRLLKAGHRCIRYPDLPPRERDDFALESKRLVAWLKDLPKPVALFAVHDRRAQQIISTATNAGLRVPEEIAVLGVDNDTLLCETTVPAISSIDVQSHDKGRRCGEILDRMLHGGRYPLVIRDVHLTIVTRHSTDAAVGVSPLIAKAVGHMQARLHENLTVREMARQCGCTPRTLQRMAHRTFGHTMGDEIRRRRLDLAAQLLATTRRTVGDIAQSCGFCGASHLGVFFKSAFAQTPSAYRKAATASHRT